MATCDYLESSTKVNSLIGSIKELVLGVAQLGDGAEYEKVRFQQLCDLDQQVDQLAEEFDRFTEKWQVNWNY